MMPLRGAVSPFASRAVVLELNTLGFRTYISEPDRREQSWIDQDDAREAVDANRRRIRGVRGQRLLRRRGERVERGVTHTYDTGGTRRLETGTCPTG